MNKKFIIGLSSLAVAGSFLACGEGEIYPFDDITDGAILAGLDDNDSSIVTNAVTACKQDPECAKLMGDAPTSQQPVATSSSAATQPGQTGTVSSSSTAAPVFRCSSSKALLLSSNSQPTSSSAPVVQGGTGDIGTCAPVTSPISKGQATTWKFVFNGKNSLGLSAKDIIGYEFNWSFGGIASPSKASETIKGLGATSEITYAKSGTGTASISISNGVAAHNVQCTDLQVNGAPITGCKCTAAETTVDVAAGGVATWTVDGCSSVGQTITGYTWTGATGEGATASYVFEEKNLTLAPTVSVANDDNTVQVFTCDEVKAINSDIPDYEILANQAAGKIAIPAGATSVHVKVPVSGQSCVIFCETTWTQELEGKLNMTVGGVKATGAYNVTVSLPVDQCDDDMIDFDLSAPATCGVQ